MESTVNFVTTIAVSNFPAALDLSSLATATKQDTQTTAIGLLGTQVTSAAILAKLTADPATQTTLAAVLAKIVSAPALDATASAGNTLLTAIKALLPTALISNRLDVNIGASSATVPVSGSVTTSGTATVTQGAAGASAWKVDGSAVTQPVSGTVAVSGTVTTAGTTTATLAAGSAAIGSVTVTSAPTTAVTIASLPALTTSAAVIGHVIADSGSTTAVTSLPALPAGSNAIGSVTVTSAPTTAITAAALPLPSGAATSALQGAGLPAAFGAGGGIKIDGSGTAVPVSGSVTVSGTSTVTQGAAGAAAWKVDGSAVTQPVSIATAPALVASSAVIGHVIADSGSTTAVTSLPALPTGSNTIGAVTGPAAAALATSAAQTTAQTSLTSIDGKLPAQGQALAASCVPVVLTAIQSAALAQDATLAARCLLGQQAIASSRSVVAALTVSTKYASIPTAGQLIKSGSTGTIYTAQYVNNTGATIFLMLFDATSTQSLGAVPMWIGTTTNTAAFNTTNFGATFGGLSGATGLWLQFSSTALTLTALASTSIPTTVITN